MALRTSRPRPLLQDENAEIALVSGKVPLHERKGLQQQGPVERKKLSNITNHVLLQPKLVGKGAAEKESFAIRADAQDAVIMSAAKKTSRPPLKNISNGATKLIDEPSSKILSKQKAEGKPQSQPSAPSRFLPSSNMNLTEEMKKKAVLWAEEGIESIHFSGEDMEKLRQKLQDEEIAKRVAMTHCRTVIPFPRFPAPHNFTWEPVDVLEPDLLKDLYDDADLDFRGLDSDVEIGETLLGCMDYLSVCSPPRFTEGWPKVREEAWPE